MIVVSENSIVSTKRVVYMCPKVTARKGLISLWETGGKNVEELDSNANGVEYDLTGADIPEPPCSDYVINWSELVAAAYNPRRMSPEMKMSFRHCGPPFTT